MLPFRNAHFIPICPLTPLPRVASLLCFLKPTFTRGLLAFVFGFTYLGCVKMPALHGYVRLPPYTYIHIYMEVSAYIFFWNPTESFHTLSAVADKQFKLNPTQWVCQGINVSLHGLPLCQQLLVAKGVAAAILTKTFVRLTRVNMWICLSAQPLTRIRASRWGYFVCQTRSIKIFAYKLLCIQAF